jgi:hypothetical protein
MLCSIFLSIGQWLWEPPYVVPEVPVDPEDETPPEPLTPEEIAAAFTAALVIEAGKHVYFQPPILMKYPCILYERYSGKTSFADNDPYSHRKRYTITAIDKNPDSLIPDEIAKLRTCVFDRHFVSNNLHHFVFNLYY